MATCKECLHYEVCGEYLPTDRDEDIWHYCREGRSDEIPDIDERCSGFQDKTQFVKVVRCKDCKHFYEINGKDSGMPCGYGQCLRPLIMPMFVNADDFCSYGERRATNEAD